MWLTSSLLLSATYVLAGSQVVLNQGQQHAIAKCVAVAADGKPITAMPDGQGSWNCVECEGESCMLSMNYLANPITDE